MSAPLVVNTKDGTVWTRRTVTSGGIALYAPEGVCSCPEFVMTTLTELAEHGISGSADVLPVPAGTESVSLSGPICSQAAARAAGLDVAPSVAELDAMAESVVASGDPLSAGVDLARAVPLLGAEVERLRARVAELEAAAVVLEVPRPGNEMPLQLRRSYGHTDRWAICDRTGRRWHREHGWVYEPDGIRYERLRNASRFTLAEALPLARSLAGTDAEDPCHPCGCPKRFNRHTDGCPAVAARPVEDPHESPLHHEFRLGRDLPETGGAS